MVHRRMEQGANFPPISENQMPNIKLSTCTTESGGNSNDWFLD